MNPDFRLVYSQFVIFGCPEWDRVVQVVFWVEIESLLVLAVSVRLVDEHRSLCTSSMTGDSALYQCSLEGSCACGSDKS